jgi:hypothetical protein
LETAASWTAGSRRRRIACGHDDGTPGLLHQGVQHIHDPASTGVVE